MVQGAHRTLGEIDGAESALELDACRGAPPPAHGAGVATWRTVTVDSYRRPIAAA